ncbi:hypothetical protein BGZ82_005013 [Podila clonocystis]|nr:hypothetical protein BGZ82_005013 [Podila clonocystis]
MLQKALILSATLAAVAFGAPVPTWDPCSTLGSFAIGNVTYEHVSDCYKSIAFLPEVAETTMKTMHTAYNDFMCFRDAALTPDLDLPFRSAPVDAIKELNKIAKKHYTGDFDFHADFLKLATSFNDPHIQYQVECYSSYVFKQPLSLYASVVGGKQVLRVFQDASGSELDDCQVLTINGQDALEHIQAWADKFSGASKDPGVRLNAALVGHTYDAVNHFWGVSDGGFRLRSTLPEEPSLDYRFKCPGRDTIKKTFKWAVTDGPEAGTFTDKTSFVANVCTAPAAGSGETSSDSTAQELELVPFIDTPAIHKHKRRRLLEQREEHTKRQLARRDVAEPSLDLLDATLVAADNQTAVYQLKSDPSVGILVVPSMMILNDGIAFMQHGLSELAARNVSRIIVDTTGNGGGYTIMATMLPTIFFPTQDKTLHSHLAEYRVSPAVQALTSADLASLTVDTTFEPRKYLNGTTHASFTTNFFLDPVNKTLNGRQAEYTQKVFGDSPLEWVDQTITYPWTNDSSKITILTDGNCGSACGMAADIFVSVHGVKAVAVGGYPGDDLSMFSYAGASVKTLDEIMGNFDELNVTAPFARLPYKGTFRVTIYDVYSRDDTVMLEYNPARHVAAHRLQYTPETARHHDLLWGAVAKTAWSS